MVCVANEVKVECVVQDGTNKSVSNVFMLPASTTTEELYKTLFSFHKCEPDSFVLWLQPYQAKNTVELSRSRDTTLLQLEPNCLNQTTIILMKATDQPPKHNVPLAPPIFVSDNASPFPDDDYPPPLATDPEDQITRKNTIFRGIDASKRLARENKYCSNNVSLNQTVDFISNHPEKNYVGLVNQAMTCYLNSLLQALYMTPEFRNALYNWEYVGGSEKEEAMSIPYQLQKLFLNLQTSTKPAVETTSLTKSFGWDSTEAWQQHDIQELCRVMFDALETKFKDTEQADLINRLYEGKMIDYVKCLECKTEKSREDTFLDIPLPVRPFESNTAYGSVEDALRAFVKYETLDGNNQYHCEKCNKKCDAHKGLKFTKFPYLLTLHLKRFDFDYNTLYRIKLNDKVTFPHVLDLNSFIATTPNHESANQEFPNHESPNREEDVGMSIKCDDSSTTDSGTLEDECLPCDGAICTNNHSGNNDQEGDEGIDMSNGIATSNGIAHNHENEKNHGKCLKDQGPYVYELFSIMIHSGSASGGHYYAYIKDFTTSQWLCFNDTTVNPITHNDIQKVYGGGPLRVYSSSTNAYMLMYRQIDKTKNAVPIQQEHFPQHIQALLKKMKETEDDDRRYHSRHSTTYKIKIYCHDPKTKKLMTNKLNTIGESTWAEQTEKAYEKFGLHGDVNLDQCRLVFYDPLNDLITHSYDGSDEDSMYVAFKGDKRNDLLLEIREKDQSFEAYKPEGIATKVYVIDVPQADIIDGPITVRGYQSQTVKQYKQQLAKIINIDPNEMNLVVMVFSQYHLMQDDKTLEAEGLDVHGEHKVYVSLIFDTDITEPSKNTTSQVPSSKLLSVIESLEKVIWIYVQLPEVNKEVIEDLNIPSLESESKQENLKQSLNGQMEVNVKDEVYLDELSEKKSVKVSANGSKFATLGLDDKIKSCQHVETATVKWQAGLESTSEDSSLSDSEKTLVDDSSGSYNNHHRFCDDSKFKKFYQSFVNSDSDEESDHYFKGTPCPSEEKEKLLRVLVDKRMRLETLKKKLEKFVGVPVDYFNVYYQSADSPEAECTDFKASLKLYNDGARFSIKLGRALRKGELKVKLYQLHLDCSEQPFKFMFDWIVAKNMTVAQAKEEILSELKRKYNLEIPFQRFRLRKKSNKVASMVLLNTSRFEDLTISSQDEVIVQELPEDETVTEPKQLVLFVRKWCRSTLQLGAIQEVVLTGRAISELKEKISLLSNLPEENIDIAKGKGSFPCESMSLLNVENDLDWKVKVTEVDKWPLDLEDGSVVLYRDSREILKQLNPEEKREFANKENSRLLSLGTTPSYSSPRREKALKIYLDSK